ncbi:MAG: hypothetical protein SFU98_00180 [Leptospiraceae bacterium]|nr:hypothetical protein [Leptospiraceae bacterium]
MKGKKLKSDQISLQSKDLPIIQDSEGNSVEIYAWLEELSASLKLATKPNRQKKAVSKRKKPNRKKKRKEAKIELKQLKFHF